MQLSVGILRLSASHARNIRLNSFCSLFSQHIRCICTKALDEVGIREQGPVMEKQQAGNSERPSFDQSTSIDFRDRIYVTKIGDMPLALSLSFSLPSAKLKEYNFLRSQSEPLSATLKRITVNIENKNVKKLEHARKLKSDRPTCEKDLQETDGTDEEGNALEIEAKLYDTEGNEVSGDLINADAWIDGRKLKIGKESSYIVMLNPPIVKSLSLPAVLMARFPVFPSYEFQFADHELSDFFWFKEGSRYDQKDAVQSKSTIDSQVKNSETSSIFREMWRVFPMLRSAWQFAGKNRSFTPHNEDIGKKVLVVCVPKNFETIGKMAAAISKSAIAPDPGICIFEDRQMHTREPVSNGAIRILSYNILADFYTDSDFSRDSLFPYCPPYALDIDYRKQLCLKEMLGYNADILCLQEVDKKVFESTIASAFRLAGYFSILSTKVAIPEGVAMIFRSSRFEMVDRHDAYLAQFLLSDISAKHLLVHLQNFPLVLGELTEKAQVVQVLTLRDTEKNRLVFVANTHLFWHPTAHYIRTIQAAVCMLHLRKVIDSYCYHELGESKPYIIFCGDFNSLPDSGVHQLMTKKSVAADFPDWMSGQENPEWFGGVEIRQDYAFESACGIPNYTNFTGDFVATLDWIFLHNFKVVRSIPMPRHETVTQHVALPSVVGPSDHIALISDVVWADDLND